MSDQRGDGVLIPSLPQPDELSSGATIPRGTTDRRGATDRRGNGFPSVRALQVLIVLLCLGLPGSYLASWYSHREQHRWVPPTEQQYHGYLAGFAFAVEHPMPAGMANFDFCDGAAHRLKRTEGEWLYFSQGCQEATGWTAGDPPLRPMGKADFLAPPR